MIFKRKRFFLLLFSIFCICVGAYFYFSYKRLPTIYDTTINSTPFQDVEFESDSLNTQKFPEKSRQIDTTENTSQSLHKYRAQRQKPSDPITTKKTFVDAKSKTGKPEIKVPEMKKIKGKELTAKNFTPNYTANARVRLTNFFNTFKNEDYISAKEFSNIYKKDPNLNKIAKTTICSFIEKHISHISRKDNQLVIHTNDKNGIHTKLKIPFVEDLRIDIPNKASISIGETFASSESTFFKAVLMPIELNGIDIIHNGDEFPKSGYISGNYYFIDYSKSKMAYKLH